MKNKLRDLIEYTKRGKIKISSPLKPGSLILNIKSNMISELKEYSVKVQDDIPYLVKDKSEDIKEENALDNFVIFQTGELKKVEERDIISVDELVIDEDTHPFNMMVISYLKTKFKTITVSPVNRMSAKGILRGFINDTKTPYSHQKLEKLFSYIGVNYKNFLDWMRNPDIVIEEDTEE